MRRRGDFPCRRFAGRHRFQRDLKHQIVPGHAVGDETVEDLHHGSRQLHQLSAAAGRLDKADNPLKHAPHTAEALAPFAEVAAVLMGHATLDEEAYQRLEILEHAATEGLAAWSDGRAEPGQAEPERQMDSREDS